MSALMEQHHRWNEARTSLGMPYTPARLVRRSAIPPIAPAAPPPKIEGRPAPVQGPPEGVPFNFLLRPAPQAIIALVALRAGLKVREVMSKRRLMSYVDARQEAMTLIRSHCGLTYPQIARLFGVDHSSVIYMVKGRKGGRKPLSELSPLNASIHSGP